MTEIFIPSSEHRTVPYYSLLLEDEYGYHHIKKTYKKYKIGDKISKLIEKKNKEIVGVIGTGVLGKDITKILLQTGYTVILRSRTKKALDNAYGLVENHLLKHFEVKEKDIIIKNLELTTDLDGLKNADFILECVVENFSIKQDLFKKLEEICNEKTIFATNTSSLSIHELASQLSKPGRLVGMHFFNPATKMQLVEVVKGKNTSKYALNTAIELAKGLNKTPVVVKDSPCFIANRILMPYLNEAVYVLHEGVAKREDIDTTARLALNHPMGPLQLLDLIGLDVFLEIMRNLHKMTGNSKYKPCPLAEKMIAEGKLGRKSGEGFYKY